jgi:hypothetical protein
MSVKFLCGLPGNGKSLLATRWIVEELVYGKRPVITNVALKREELAAFIAREHPTADVDLHTRLVLLDEDATGRFWLTRGVGLRLAHVTTECEKEGKRLDFTKVIIPTQEYATELRQSGLEISSSLAGEAWNADGAHFWVSAYALGGVLYVIDEIHIYFDSRAWQTTGQSALFYLSQHRKLGDDVVCITQSLENVEKRFRKLAQDFTYVKYLKKLKFGFGLFSPPPVFLRSVYTSPPGPTSKAMETRTYTLDVSGYASCYDTAAGVGVVGNRADTMEKSRGLNYKWFVVVVALFIGGLYFVPNVFSALLGFGLDKMMVTGGKKPDTHPAGTAAPSSAPLVASSNREPMVVVMTTTKPIEDSDSVYMTAYVVAAGIGRVGLSDGRWLRGNDPLLTQVTDSWCVYDGVRYRQAPASPGGRAHIHSDVPAQRPTQLPPRPKKAVVHWQ